MPAFYPHSASLLPIAVFGLLTFTLCAASVVLCWVHRARVTRVASGQTLALARALKRIPPEHRLDAVVQRASQETWEHRWALAIAACSHADAQVAVTNELLLDLDHELSGGSRWPASAARASALGALLFAVLAFLAGGHVPAIACIIATGLCSAVACAALGKGTRNEAAHRREAIDSLVDAVLGHLSLSDDHVAALQTRAWSSSALGRANVRLRPSHAARRSGQHGRG